MIHTTYLVHINNNQIMVIFQSSTLMYTIHNTHQFRHQHSYYSPIHRHQHLYFNHNTHHFQTSIFYLQNAFHSYHLYACGTDSTHQFLYVKVVLLNIHSPISPKVLIMIWCMRTLTDT